MSPELLDLLCDPDTRAPLSLKDPIYDTNGKIISGVLATPKGKTYPIINGIPRFVPAQLKASVESFGDEWNYFNFIDFKASWLNHTIKNTFVSPEAFKGKVVIDCGAGSGSQTLWMLESGAKHVIALELSHSVDDVMQRNLANSVYTNYDIIQCSIDNPPLRSRSINGIVICHNVIQHTPSVEKTAQALFDLVGEGGEFVFNCYPLNDQGLVRWIRAHCINGPLRSLLSRLPFTVNLYYARLMGLLGIIPGIGFLVEKLGFCMRGDHSMLKSLDFKHRLKLRYRGIVLNTFDWFGSHKFQQYKSNDEIKALLNVLQPQSAKILNQDEYFTRPMPHGCALRVLR